MAENIVRKQEFIRPDSTSVQIFIFLNFEWSKNRVKKIKEVVAKKKL